MLPLVRLHLWTFKNALRTLFTDPRKFGPTIFVVAMIGFSLFITSITSSLGSSSQSTAPYPLPLPVVEALTHAAFALLIWWAIDLAIGDKALLYNRSSLDFLFPSPISRRMVLLCRVPAQFLSSLVNSAAVFYLVRSIVMVGSGGKAMASMASNVPWYVGIFALTLANGSYSNLATTLAVMKRDRRWMRIGFGVIGVCYMLSLGFVLRSGQLEGVRPIIENPVFAFLTYPMSLASRACVASLLPYSIGSSMSLLFGIWVVSHIPMFIPNSNWYEESIENSERFAALRVAAKSGFAGMMAHKAQTRKYRARRTYIVPPFGHGSTALLWAHLSAAAKRPIPNFLLPLVAGLFSAVGISFLPPGRSAAPVAVIFIALLLIYSGFFFMASARTASEAAIRRRDLTSPLPISGAGSVAMNLAVPWISVALFALGFTVSYLLAGGSYALEVAATLLLVYPARLAVRMVVQYFIVLMNPDLEDKVQQFFVQMFSFFLGTPFLIVEAVLIFIAFFLKSIPLGIGLMAVAQGLFLLLVLPLAGRLNDRSVSSGEPIRWRNVFGR